MLVIVAAAALSGAAPSYAADEVKPTLVQTIATSAFNPPSPDPSGIVYIPDEDRFLIADSEVNEMTIYQGSNLFAATRTGSGVGTGTTLTHASKEPAGLGFNPTDGTLFESNDDADKVWQIRPGPDTRYGTSDDLVSSFGTAAFGSTDPEGVEYDTATGHLFICDGGGLKVVEIDPVNGTFGDGNDVSSSFSLSGIAARDCEGIGIDSQRNSLLVVDPSRRKIYELTKSGTLLRTLVLDQTVIPTTSTIFASVTMAPTSDPLDSPAAMNYWLVDRHVDNGADPNENDGLLYELSLGTAPPPDGPPSVTITSPAESAAVSGNTLVQVNAVDDTAVDHVSVAVDGVAIGTDADGSNGWSVPWNTTSATNGSHTVTATAVDSGGQSGNDSNNVTVDNAAPSVAITAPIAGATVSGVVALTASASDNDSVASVRFLVDGATVGTDSDGANGWSVPWNTSSVPPGQHTISAVATDRAGNAGSSDPVDVVVDDLQLIDIGIATGTDDADEVNSTGQVRRSNRDLELGSDKGPEPTTTGLRFTGVPIPQGAMIESASVQFKADERGKGAAALVIKAQNSDNATTFTTATANISSRPLTTASVSWSVPQWLTAGAAGPDQRSPNISGMIQEVVSRPGWSPGNSLAIIITGTGRRTAASFESGAPPVLHVEYSTP